MLAQNGTEIDRRQLINQLKEIRWKILEQTGENDLPIKLAIEKLEDSLQKGR